MRHTVLTIGLALAVASALAGCAKQPAETSSSFTRDSLLAADPREPRDRKSVV